MIENGYRAGDYLAICDRCGFEYYNSQLVSEWTGLRVCAKCVDKKPIYPTQEPDRVAVQFPRPENDQDALGYEYLFIGENLFPDPWVDPTKDSLWSDGTDSQQHVYAGYYSKRLDSETSTITVSGLEIEKVYRISSAVWSPNTTETVLINGVDSGLFALITAKQWATDSVLYTADTEEITITFDSGTSSVYFDNNYVQLYENRVLLPSEIIENKKPTTIDNSVDGLQLDFFSFSGHDDFNSKGFGSGTSGGIFIKGA